MVLAEKCPNCGAYLPVRRAGVEVRRCEFCGLEVPGDTRPIEVDELTKIDEARRRFVSELAARQAALASGAAPAPPSTWLPGQARPSDGLVDRPPAKAPNVGLGCGVLAVVVLGAIGGGITCGVRKSSMRPLGYQVDQARRDDYARAQKAAAQAAGGWARLDVESFAGFAEHRARGLLPDAGLVRMHIRHVRADGRADQTLGERTTSFIEWRSPRASRAPAGTPAGVTDVQLACEVHVSFGPEHPYEPTLSENSIGSCRDPIVHPPRCTLAQVWQRAQAKGAPADAVAQISLAADHRHDDEGDPDVPRAGLWQFSIDAVDSKDRFDVQLADDCGVVVAPSTPPDHDAAPADAALDAPVPVDEAAFRVLARRRGGLHLCLLRATKDHPAIEAVDARWAFRLDERGRIQGTTSHADLDIEGVFVGHLQRVEDEFMRCADPLLQVLVFPPPEAGATHRVIGVRLTRADGKLSAVPLTARQLGSITR